MRAALNESAGRPRLAWLATLAMIAVCATGARAQLTDRAVCDAVEDRLRDDPAVMAEGLDISAAGGLVTLSGQADCLACRLRAGAVAETVRGVRGVINRIQVAPPPTRSDESAVRDVERALQYDPATASGGMKAKVERGVVTLTGAVDSWQQKQLAQDVVSSVAGVTEVKNAVQIRPGAARDDAEIEAEIRQNLRWDTRVDHALIDVGVHKRLVRLTGTVASAAELSRARDAARVAGVEMVDASTLTVERWSRDKELRRGKYEAISPQELQQAARQMLARDGHVAGFAVSVESEDGSLVLRGTVTNLYARRSAQRTLRHVVGAGAIINRIKVRPAEAAEDTVVAADIRQALRRDSYLSGLPIQVAAAGGVARLTGSADNYFQKARADDLAAQARGIVAVSNQIEVLADVRAFVASPYLDDADARDFPWYSAPPRQASQEDPRISAAVAENLRWSPYVNAEAVKVAVRSGVVTLSGTVGCPMQKLTAEHSAYAGGAAAVVNELKVE